MKKLHEDMVNIQVENSTLQSQSSSLLSQINQLQITQGTLETSKRKVRFFNCIATEIAIVIPMISGRGGGKALQGGAHRSPT